MLIIFLFCLFSLFLVVLAVSHRNTQTQSCSVNQLFSHPAGHKPKETPWNLDKGNLSGPNTLLYKLGYTACLWIILIENDHAEIQQNKHKSLVTAS